MWVRSVVIDEAQYTSAEQVIANRVTGLAQPGETELGQYQEGLEMT
jgi:hypothetical protein